MKMNIFSKFIVFVFSFLLVTALPVTALALDGSSFPCPQGLNCSTQISGGNVPVALNGLISQVIQWLLSIALGLAVLFVVIGGFRYMVSAGNEESAEAAKNTVINSLIGIVLIILSYSVVQVVVNLVSRSGGGAGNP